MTIREMIHQTTWMSFMFLISTSLFYYDPACIFRKYFFSSFSQAGGQSSTSTRSASPSTEDQPHPKRRRQQAQPLDDVDRALMDSFHKLTEPRAPPDAEQLFGQHVASILRTLPPQKQAFAKLEIDRLFLIIYSFQTHHHLHLHNIHSHILLPIIQTTFIKCIIIIKFNNCLKVI